MWDAEARAENAGDRVRALIAPRHALRKPAREVACTKRLYGA